jgi:hypothetical protein
MSGSRSSSGSSRPLLLLAALGVAAAVGALWFVRSRPALSAPDAGVVDPIDPIERSLDRLRKRGPVTEVDREKIARLLAAFRTATATMDPDEPDAAPSPDAAPAPDAAYSVADLLEAEDLYNEGAGAFRHGEYERAAELFLDGYERVRLPLMIFNVSVALAKLGRCAEAIEVMRWYLDEATSPREKSLGEEKLAELSARCP